MRDYTIDVRRLHVPKVREAHHSIMIHPMKQPIPALIIAAGHLGDGPREADFISDQTPRLRPMISFMISVVPP